MRCRSILKWIGLTAISLTVVFLLSTITRDNTASASIDNTRPQTQGSLEVFDQNGKPAGECPLKHTEVKAQVSGFLSRVTVTQDFENNFPNKIEAVYTFPLPQAAAVDDLTMLIGERVIKGKIMRREEAQPPTPPLSKWERLPVCWIRNDRIFLRSRSPTSCRVKAFAL
jgi:Ca-activated chloride channel family protein